MIDHIPVHDDNIPWLHASQEFVLFGHYSCTMPNKTNSCDASNQSILSSRISFLRNIQVSEQIN